MSNTGKKNVESWLKATFKTSTFKATKSVLQLKFYLSFL